MPYPQTPRLATASRWAEELSPSEVERKGIEVFHGKKIVVVMPAYNAARTIEQTYREIPLDLVDEVVVTGGEGGIRFLFVSGKPIEEPVAWRGPIVMNTQAELRQAYAELDNGTFIKKQ